MLVWWRSLDDLYQWPCDWKEEDVGIRSGGIKAGHWQPASQLQGEAWSSSKEKTCGESLTTGRNKLLLQLECLNFLTSKVDLLLIQTVPAAACKAILYNDSNTFCGKGAGWGQNLDEGGFTRAIVVHCAYCCIQNCKTMQGRPRMNDWRREKSVHNTDLKKTEHLVEEEKRSNWKQ